MKFSDILHVTLDLFDGAAGAAASGAGEGAGSGTQGETQQTSPAATRRGSSLFACHTPGQALIQWGVPYEREGVTWWTAHFSRWLP